MAFVPDWFVLGARNFWQYFDELFGHDDDKEAEEIVASALYLARVPESDADRVRTILVRQVHRHADLYVIPRSDAAEQLVGAYRRVLPVPSFGFRLLPAFEKHGLLLDDPDRMFALLRGLRQRAERAKRRESRPDRAHRFARTISADVRLLGHVRAGCNGITPLMCREPATMLRALDLADRYGLYRLADCWHFVHAIQLRGFDAHPIEGYLSVHGPQAIANLTTLLEEPMLAESDLGSLMRRPDLVGPTAGRIDEIVRAWTASGRVDAFASFAEHRLATAPPPVARPGWSSATSSSA